jgi:hypothetical protein
LATLAQGRFLALCVMALATERQLRWLGWPGNCAEVNVCAEPPDCTDMDADDVPRLASIWKSAKDSSCSNRRGVALGTWRDSDARMESVRPMDIEVSEKRALSECSDLLAGNMAELSASLKTRLGVCSNGARPR